VIVREGSMTATGDERALADWLRRLHQPLFEVVVSARVIRNRRMASS